MAINNMQTSMQPTPNHKPIQVVVRAVVGALPHLARPTRYLFGRGHQLVGPAKPSVAKL